MDFLPFTRPQFDEETIAGVAEVMRSGWVTSGPQVKQFEAELSTLFGNRPVVTLNSGTAALELALRAASIGAGDEVITTPLSWVATTNVILEVGARPVFVDVDARTRNIDLDLAEAAITPRTKAILPVHLAGLPVDLDRLYGLGTKHRLRLIEDAAQAIGSTWQGRAIGATGDLIAFSFHANKNITTTEGGCLVVPDEATAERVRLMRLQGVVRTGDDGMDVSEVGYKFNMTDIAARIGLGQLRRLGEFTARRRALARRYFEQFDTTLGCELPVRDLEQSNWHMFQIVLPLDRLRITRAEFMARMREAGIGTGVHYPAIHLFTLLRRQGWKDGDCPNAERIGRGTVTLPLHPGMQEGDVDRVCATTARILKEQLR